MGKRYIAVLKYYWVILQLCLNQEYDNMPDQILRNKYIKYF